VTLETVKYILFMTL